MSYSFFKVDIKEKIATVSFNKPEKSNALAMEDWREMKLVFEDLDAQSEVRVIVLKGEGKNFCAGIDINTLGGLMQAEGNDEGRKRERLYRSLLELQSCITAIESCRKPVLAAIHRACIGGGVDIIAACDMRYCSEDAYFSIREIDMGLVADIGTLQRLPTVLNPGILAEMAYTGRNVMAEEAAQIGLVNRAYPSQEAMMTAVYEIAHTIASKSPLVIRGIKQHLLYKRDHTVADSLQNIASWNAATLLSNDLMEAMQAYMQKRTASFGD